MKPVQIAFAAMLLCIFIACNNKGKDQLTVSKEVAASNKSFKTDYADAGLITGDSSAIQKNATSKQPAPSNNTAAREDWDKKIIKTGNLTLEVKNYKTFNELLHNVVKQFGGYVAQEEQNQSDYKIENIITIKVPVDQFDNAIMQMTPGTEKIVAKKINSEDVTGEIIDTKSRMEAKKRVRDRYLDMLKQAKNMEEILQVQNEVNGMQENIEAAAGRINYLGHAASFSTINITFYQVLNPDVKNDPGPSYGFRILESFKSGLHWFAELFIMLVSLWPLWLGITLSFLFVRKRLSVAKNQKAGS